VISVGGASGFAWQRYSLKTTFENVQGLKSGAIVRVAGVEVGKVTDVDLKGSGVEVDLSIKKDNQSRITTDSRASIGSMSLLGEPLIDVSPASTGTAVNFSLDYALAAAAGNGYQGGSTTVTLTFHAVQSGNNALPSGCAAGQQCNSGSGFAWS